MMDQSDTDRLADDISRKYPYPLAATYWRAFYTAADADESHEYLLDLYEITMMYCSAIVVSQYIADGVNDAKINQDLQRLQRPSLGHWQGWLRDILMLYHRTKRHLVVPELATFYMRSDAAGLLQAYQTLQRQVEHQSNISKVTPQQFFELLGAYRNRLAHGAWPSSYAKERVAIVLMPAMRELFRQLSFLAEYRLVYLSKVTVEFDERRSGPLRYAYAHNLTYLTGGSPHVSPVPQVLNQAWRDKRLYLLDKGGGFQPMLSLHPLLIFRPCERCNRDQVFLLNSTNDRALDYLSYQCTHHFNPTEYVDDVRLLLEGLKEMTERNTPQPSSGEDAMPLAQGQDTRDNERTVMRESKREQQAGRQALRGTNRPSTASPVQTTREPVVRSTREGATQPLHEQAHQEGAEHQASEEDERQVDKPAVQDTAVAGTDGRGLAAQASAQEDPERPRSQPAISPAEQERRETGPIEVTAPFDTAAYETRESTPVPVNEHMPEPMEREASTVPVLAPRPPWRRLSRPRLLGGGIGVLVLVVVVAFIAWLLAFVLSPSDPINPIISTVTFTGGPYNPRVTITGVGFGTAPRPTSSYSQKFRGANYGTLLHIRDNTNGLDAGYDNPSDDRYDVVSLVLTSYTDSRVSFALGTSYDECRCGLLNQGDLFKVWIKNLSCSGTIRYNSTVTCPSPIRDYEPDARPGL